MLKIEITCELKERNGEKGVIIENKVVGAACCAEVEKAVKTMSENCALLIKSVPDAARLALMDACMDGFKELER